jgi:hypothetical protein
MVKKPHMKYLAAERRYKSTSSKTNLSIYIYIKRPAEYDA